MKRTTLEGYDLELDFKGFHYTNGAFTRHPRMKAKKDGVIRVAGMCYWKGPAWVILVEQGRVSCDATLVAEFESTALGEADVVVCVKDDGKTIHGGGITDAGLTLLRAFLGPRERDLFELGMRLGCQHKEQVDAGTREAVGVAEQTPSDMGKVCTPMALKDAKAESSD